MTAAASRVDLLNKDNLQLAFKMLDANGDGTISAEEIRTAFSRGNMASLENHQVEMEDDFWEVMLSDMDQNKDGKVDFEEFELYMMSLVQREHVENGKQAE